MGTNSRIPHPNWNCELVIVLVDPQFEGNIGAVARCIRNFGLHELRILRHNGDFSEETRNRAKHAQNVLDDCQIHEEWETCFDDISLVIGTSGKREHGDKVLFRHFLLPSELGERLSEVQGKVAIVFGPEGMGLSQEELRSCDLLMTIPTWEGYPILNLSHTVAIVCYEWFKTLLPKIGKEEALPKTVHVDRLLNPNLRREIRNRAEEIAASAAQRDDQIKSAADTLSRVILRGIPTDDEAHRLLGLLNTAAKAMQGDER
ncbi:MAG: TrmJ/YjtD family RNA methyltransferase [Candidatus Thermoplasmatota archaeon]|mgnify:CR=1 FL=1|nr:TrmJ/YjtD family RNA methyltransferase [Candidatus Thermoplasmatota archaeon]MED5486484.1 TrmJ/YjtD family RNA methyltransferase [Candidatus Thermoplasmatota archaeon]